MALQGKWFAGNMTPAEKAQRELTIRHSKTTLDILSAVIEQEIKSLQQPKFVDYTLPGWDYREADRHGQIRALTEILKMTNLESTGVRTND